MIDRIFQHPNPVWREKADFIIGAYVPPLQKSPEEKAWEQLWAKRLTSYRFIICCIPLFTYGLALGDEVETDSDYMIRKVIKRSGHVTLRLWFNETALDNIKKTIIQGLMDHECLIEWYSNSLVGVNIEDPSNTDLILEALSVHQNHELISIEIANR